MATSSDETMGEVSSKSAKLLPLLRIRRDRLIGKKKSTTNRDHLNHPDNNHDHNHNQPLTGNLSTWIGRRRLRCIKRPPVDDYLHRLSLTKNTVTNSYMRRSYYFQTNKDIPGTALCRKCKAVKNNTDLCSSCLNIREDRVDGLPKSIAVRYCLGCQSYSFTGRADFVPASILSTPLLNFLLRRLEVNLFRHDLTLLSASFLPTGPDPNRIKVGLVLQEEDLVDRVTLTKRHVVNYVVSHQTCLHCKSQKPVSQCSHIVQFRMCDSDKRSIGKFMLKIGKPDCEVRLKKMKLAERGLDIYFDTINDAMIYFNFICSRFPMKPSKLQINPSSGNYIIPATVCPIAEEDLVYIRSNKVLVDSCFSGPVALCTNVSNSISLLDPVKLTEITVSCGEYWNESNAFDVYKTYRDLKEYIVFDVKVISREGVYPLTELLVSRAGDFGKSDVAFTTQTHLDGFLVGDHAFGYDLYNENNSNSSSNPMISDEGNDSESLPDVIIVKKKGVRSQRRVMGKYTSPEYEDFLRELDSNPESMFSLSLNCEKKDENKMEMKDGGKDSCSDIDLEGLLADLVLGDQQNVA